MRLSKWIVFLSVLLVGCSEEKSNSTTDPTQIDNNEVINSTVKNEETDVSEIQEKVEKEEVNENINIENADEIEKEAEIKEIEMEGVKTSNNAAGIPSESIVLENGESIENYNLYSHYVEENFVEDEIVFEEVEENIISLPKLEENREVFENEISYVKLQQLKEEDIILVLTEEVPFGALIVFRMYKLLEKYPAKSYSLFYNDEEYSIIIEDSDPSVGMIYLDNPEVDESITFDLDLNILGK